MLHPRWARVLRSIPLNLRVEDRWSASRQQRFLYVLEWGVTLEHGAETYTLVEMTMRMCRRELRTSFRAPRQRVPKSSNRSIALLQDHVAPSLLVGREPSIAHSR